MLTRSFEEDDMSIYGYPLKVTLEGDNLPVEISVLFSTDQLKDLKKFCEEHAKENKSTNVGVLLEFLREAAS